MIKRYLMSDRLWVAIIVVAAFFLRVYRVAEVPPSLSWDEVSIGYNAYSILKTGRDEHGRFLPVDAFTAYGDYKPPLPVYLTVPFIAVFGLNEYGVRMPSVIAGTLSVFFTFLMVRELVSGKKRAEKRRDSPEGVESRWFPVLASGVLAVSPWQIQLSRAGWEANIALTFIIAGVYLFLYARKNPMLYVTAFLPFTASIYTFNSARYFSPILVFGLFLFVKRDIARVRKFLAAGLLVALITLIPIAPHLISPQARLRFQEVNIFTDLSVITKANDRIAYENGAVWAKIFQNRRVGYMLSFLRHYADNLDPRFLFIRGDGNPKFSLQDVGQLHLIEAPLLILGVYAMFRMYPQLALFLLFWLLTAIIPAAVARETPHALRTLNTLPTWQIFAALGVLWVVGTQTAEWKKKFTVVLLVLGYAGSIVYFTHNYFVHYPREYAGEWQYGYKQALEAIHKLKEPYHSIMMTDQIGRPYMYVLFYEAYDPNRFLASADSSFDQAGFYHVYGFDRYRFVKRIGETEMAPGTVYVLPSNEVPRGVNILETIRLPNGEPTLTIFRV